MLKENNVFLIRRKVLSNIRFGILSLASLLIISCNDVGLPEAGSIADKTPPKADFSYATSSTSDLTIKFSSLSTSATKYSWDFGEASSTTDVSTSENPIHSFAAYGTYTVTLNVSDNLGVANTLTKDVVVKAGPFQPVISESGFEDNSDGADACGDGLDGRDCWRNSQLGGVIQITSSPVRTGEQAAKLTGSASDARIGYQLVTVEAQTNYDVNFYYTMKDDQTGGFLTVSVLSGPVETHAEALAATIGTVTVNDQSDPASYVDAKVSFNSGTSTQVAIYFFNEGSVETRLDDFTIDIAADAIVPPSPSFTLSQSATNYLAYSFTNGSTNASTYAWDFGDDNTSTDASPSHTYGAAGSYTVKLTATNEFGTSKEFSTTIDVQQPVSASFEYTVDPNDYKTITFTETSTNSHTRLWDLDDGYLSSAAPLTHTYAEDGEYDVKLTATSITGQTSTSTMKIQVAQGFIVSVLNGTFDEYTSNTGDNADAWDMTPSSTVVDNNGISIPSPYRPLWNNGDLNTYIDNTYCTNEQPGSTSDGNNGSRGGKLSNSCRRLYQVVSVEQGASYTFSIDSRSEATGVNTEVFILNTEITTEAGIDASKSDAAIDAYLEITNDHSTTKSEFVTSTLNFTPTTNKIVIYVRALDAVDSSHEVFIDNITITDN